MAVSSSGLGHRPFTAKTPVQIWLPSSVKWLRSSEVEQSLEER